MKNKKRYWIYLALLIFLPLVVELFLYNFHPVVKQDSSEIIFIKGQQLENNNIKQAKATQMGGKIALKEEQYIKKLTVQLDTTDVTTYVVTVKYRNMFGVVKEEKISDVYYPELNAGVTNINKKVKSIQVQHARADANGITSMMLTNKREINTYRLFFFAAVIFICLLFIEKKNWFVQRLEWVVVAVCLLLGSLCIYSQGVNENGWDEQVHFKSAYNMSYLGNIQNSYTYEKMKERLPVNYYNTLEEKQLVTQYLNVNYDTSGEINKEVPFSYNKAAYVLQAATLYLGRHLGLSFNKIFMMGKFINLLTYIFIVFWAVRLMPGKKELIAAVSMIPTQVFIAGTYTYDVAVHGLLLLGFVLWMKVILEEPGKYTIYYIIGSMCAFGVGSLSKAIYIPLILLCCLIPKNKFASQKQYRILWGTIIAAFIVVLCTFVLPAMSNMISGNSGWGSDPRGGETDAVAQMQLMFKQLPQYLYLMFFSILKTAGDFFTGHEGLANFGRMQELEQGFLWITTGWILVMAFVQRKDDSFFLLKKYKLSILFFSIIIMALIWTSMYLSYTPVGDTQIAGVQARYYLPLLAPLLLVCTNRRFRIDVKEATFNRILLGVPTGLLLFGIYLNLLKGYCF